MKNLCSAFIGALTFPFRRSKSPKGAGLSSGPDHQLHKDNTYSSSHHDQGHVENLSPGDASFNELGCRGSLSMKLRLEK